MIVLVNQLVLALVKISFYKSLSTDQGLKFSEEYKSVFSKTVNKEMLNDITFYLEDDHKFEDDFSGETFEFTAMLIKLETLLSNF